MDQMTLWFEGVGDNQGDAVVNIKIMQSHFMDDDMSALRFDVELYSLPDNKEVGHEVTVNFHSDIYNNGTFYTDSNGLEMQQRKLNYRPSYNISIMDGGLNVTANYYPVQTAIGIIDAENPDMRMVVMNDRSQGASVIENGRIEFMQNRRLN